MQFNKTTLENGLRILTVPMPGTLTTTVTVLVEAGSEYENKEINGLSHFLEHMCFKGTLKRPKAIDITRELDGIGAAYNAFTSNEVTGYYAKSEAGHLDKILDIVSDLYLNPVFDPNEIAKEKGVIIEEINMYEDMPMNKAHAVFTKLVYGDQPAGWDILGEKDVVTGLKQEDFIKYRNARYVASNTLVIVAGNFEETETIEKIKTLFSGVKLGEKVTKPVTVESQSSPAVFIHPKNSDQTHLVLGARAFNVFDDRRFTLEVLSDLLGGGMSSRLFVKVREELGAAYYVHAEDQLFLDHGYFSVSAGVANDKLEVVLAVILGELKDLRDNLVSDRELAIAKNHLVGNIVIGLETSDDISRFYGSEEIMTGNILSPKELEEKVRAVTAEEIRSLAKDIFRNSSLNLALVGPVKEEEPLRRLLTLD